MTEAMGRVVLLERIVDGVLPEYCLHGRVECTRCRHWCHLGHETEKVVVSGDASPLCLDCVNQLRAEGLWPEDIQPTGRLQDNRRVDGPHDEEIPADWEQTPCGNPTCPRTVWGPPFPPGDVPVVKVCSTACAELMSNTYLSMRDS